MKFLYFTEVIMSGLYFKRRFFWQEFLVTSSIAIGVDILLSLIIGFEHLSNLFFYSTIVLLAIATIPILGDFGNTRRAVRELRKQGNMSDPVSGEIEELETKSGTHTTLIFSLSAVINFILSILTGSL